MAELATSLVVTEAERLNAAEADVRDYCGWHIAPSRTETVTILEPSGSRVLMLPSMHVTEVVSVTEDGSAVLAADFTVDERGWLIREAGWWTGPVVVEFTHGYAEVPANVSTVVKALAQRGVDGVQSAKSWSRTDGPFSDSASYESGDQFYASEKATLRRYKIPTVA